MNLSSQDKRELFKIKKNAFIIVAILLFIQLWLLWDVRKKMSLDYSFLSENKSTINATVFQIKEFSVERENASGRIYSNEGYEYNYKFSLGDKVYGGKDYSFSSSIHKDDTPFDIRIEYLTGNPSINRVLDFGNIKDTFDFFKEYFMFKIITLLITILYLINNFRNEKKKV